MANLKFTSFPILTTERVHLRQLSITDQNDIFTLRSNSEINKYLNRKPSKTLEDAQKFISNVNDNINKNQALYWAIILKKTEELVGTICLFDFSKENDSCEIGYELMPNFQGQGIMTETTQKVIEFVFQNLKIKKIYAYTHFKNENSTKLLLKLDFVKSSEVYKDNLNINIFTLTQ